MGSSRLRKFFFFNLIFSPWGERGGGERRWRVGVGFFLMESVSWVSVCVCVCSIYMNKMEGRGGLVWVGRREEMLAGKKKKKNTYFEMM